MNFLKIFCDRSVRSRRRVLNKTTEEVRRGWLIGRSTQVRCRQVQLLTAGWACSKANSGSKQYPALFPSTAFKKSFLLNLGSKSFFCDRIEGHKIIAATRHLELRLRSRPFQKRTTEQMTGGATQVQPRFNPGSTQVQPRLNPV